MIAPANGRSGYTCRFQVKLRDDDIAILEEIQRRTGLGTIRIDTSRTPTPGGKPRAVWRVSSKRECTVLTRLFDRYPLRAKKRNDFLLWKMAVADLCTATRHGKYCRNGEGHDWSVMAELYEALKSERTYDDEGEAVVVSALERRHPQLRLIS